MKRLLYIITLALATMLTGCAVLTPPTQAIMDAADYGTTPSDDEVKKLINVYLENTLKDFESARIRNIKKEKGHHNHSIVGKGSTYTFGWYVSFEVNAKNSYGGYVGYKNYFILIRNGETLSAGLR